MTPSRLFKSLNIVIVATLFGTTFAQAETGPVVYIPTGEGAEVLVVDAGTNEPIGQIAGLPAAHGLAVTPDGRRLIVGSFEERAMGEASPDKPAGVSTVDHEAHHAPKAKVEVEAEISTLSVVDTTTRSILRRIDVPGAVHHVAVSPDGRVAVVTHPNSNSVSVVDLDAMTVTKTVTTGEMPNYAVFSKDGGKLYVSNAGEDAIAVLDAATWSTTAKIPTGESPEHLVLSPDGGTLFANNVVGGSISVVDLATERATKTMLIGETLHGLDVSDDGETLFIAVRGDDKLVAVNLDTGDERSVTLSPSPYHLSVIKGAGVVYVSSAEDPIVWVIDAATLETVAKIAIPGTGHQFAQSAGG